MGSVLLPINPTPAMELGSTPNVLPNVASQVMTGVSVAVPPNKAAGVEVDVPWTWTTRLLVGIEFQTPVAAPITSLIFVGQFALLSLKVTIFCPHPVCRESVVISVNPFA